MELDAGNEELQTLNAELGAVDARLRIQNEELQREIAERLRVDAALAEKGGGARVTVLTHAPDMLPVIRK